MKSTKSSLQSMHNKKPLVLAVIPAKKISRRLTGKNLKRLCGHPLIAWTIDAAKNSAIQWNRKIMIDMINLEDPIMKWTDFMKMGMDYGCLHTAHDDVTDGENSLETVEKFHEAHGGQQISVAGGIDPEKIRNLKSCQPEILVVGSYITTAADPSKAVKTIRQVMNEISI